MKKTLPIPYLHELLDADFEAGTLTWRRRPVERFKDGKQSAAHNAAIWNSRYAGKVAGTRDNNGYLCFKISDRNYFVHRTLWAMANGVWPEDQIDHANGVRDDNRLSNLRAVSHAENGRNRTARRGGTSRFPGVYWHKSDGKWRAKIMIDGKTKHLGMFTKELKAAAAYRTAARALGFTERHLQPTGDAQ